MSESMPPPSSSEHLAHFLPDGIQICGGTQPPTLARLLPVISPVDFAQVRVDIFPQNTDLHEQPPVTLPITQEILRRVDEEEVFTPPIAARYIKSALAFNGFSGQRPHRRPVVDIVDEHKFGAAESRKLSDESQHLAQDASMRPMQQKTT